MGPFVSTPKMEVPEGTGAPGGLVGVGHPGPS
jgi:hypothetical protein